MAWIILSIAGIFEIVWAIGLKDTQGLTQLWPSVGTLSAMVVSVVMLGFAMKELPVGTAYAVWTGIGTVGTACLGLLLFGDSATPMHLFCIGFILTGIIGLKMLPLLTWFGWNGVAFLIPDGV